MASLFLQAYILHRQNLPCSCINARIYHEVTKVLCSCIINALIGYRRRSQTETSFTHIPKSKGVVVFSRINLHTTKSKCPLFPRINTHRKSEGPFFPHIHKYTTKSKSHFFSYKIHTYTTSK